MKNIIKIIFVLAPFFGLSQMVPGEDENIPYLINFGANAKHSFGDDDFNQAFYFVVPKTYNQPFYVRIFDPEIGGLHDEIIDKSDTKTKFSFFGGAGIYSKALGVNAPKVSETAMGDLLEEEEFDSDSEYDDSWYSFGPFNPKEGEFVKEFDGYVFKMLSEGMSGNDGNCYKYFLSNKSNENSAIPGGNAFTFEYTIRLHDKWDEVSHLYPFVDNEVVKLKQHNFDLDGSCDIKIFSVKRMGERAKVSSDNNWVSSMHTVYDAERESCMDFQIRNKRDANAKFNNTVVYITNQYGEFLPFMAIPIGDFTPKKQINVESD